jgi:hypothetical protein
MAGSKRNIEFVDQQLEQKEIRKGSLRDIFDGTVLTRERVTRQLPFVLFITLLMIIYIGNRYHSEKVIRESILLQTELKELRARAISTASELEYISTRTEVAKRVRSQVPGLMEAENPPYKIDVKKKSRHVD